MIKVLEYANRNITLKSYNTEIERDLLIYTSDEYDLDDILFILKDCIITNIPIKQLSYYEKLNILLQLRNISVGEIFNITCKCNACGKTYDAEISFNDNIFNNSNIPDFNNIKITEAFTDNYNDYVDFNIDDLEIDEYDKLVAHIEKYRTAFNFECETTCLYCKDKGTIHLKEKLIIDNLSDDSLSTFYEVISHMVYFGNYTLADVYKMLPFERSIYLGLLNKQKKDQNNINT